MEQNKKNEKTCEICREPAKILCLNCNSYLCDSCSKFVHEKKNNIQHRKEEIDPYIPIDIKCPDHPNIPMNLFCVDDKGEYNIFFLKLYRTVMLSMPLS